MENIHPYFTERRSWVRFQPVSLDEQSVGLLIDAIRWSPSSSNIQPWRIIVASRENKDHWAQVISCLKEGNQVWAVNASLLIILLADTIHPATNKYNSYAWHDCGIALGNLMFQAHALGLITHPMGGFNSEQIRQLFLLPVNLEPVTCTAIGYYSKDTELPDYLLDREKSVRKRKDISELVWKKL